MKWIKNLIVISTISFLLLELCLAIYTHLVQPKIELPTYSFENTQSFWYDLNEDYGTSHLPNHSYRQKKTCFDIVYKSNNQGFRDKNRELNSNKKRVLVIGDSFIEGLGVELNNRLTDLLEEDTKIAHLNFGLAGNFGPTQYSKLYEKTAILYEHDAILVGVLPANDFIDDDYKINQKIGSNRYKPYWIGKFPDYQLVYFQDSIHKSSVNQQDIKPFKKILKNFSYSYNYLIYIRTLLRQSVSTEDPLITNNEVPTYFNFTEEQLNRLKYALIQLKKLAKNRKVMIFTIPTASEIITFKEQGKNPLAKELNSFCKINNIEYLDLLEHSYSLSKNEIENLFLSCDGHWSSNGNRFAKNKIQEHFSLYK